MKWQFQGWVILEVTLVKGSLFDFWRKASRSHFQISITIIIIIIYLFNFKNFIFCKIFKPVESNRPPAWRAGTTGPCCCPPTRRRSQSEWLPDNGYFHKRPFQKNMLNQTMSIYNSTYVEMLISPFGTCTQKTENALFWVDSKIWPAPYVGQVNEGSSSITKCASSN
jgi:hypothetical protein